MHTATIKSIATDAANRFVVTGSDDKTVRVWDAQSGALLRTICPPLGEGHDGKIFAVALSPNGEMVACGGWTSNDTGNVESIYLFDRGSGQMLWHIGGLPNGVAHLAFSPDGARLAAGLGRGGGIYVFRAANGAVVAQDAAYGSTCYGLDYDAEERLVTSCSDGFVRLYDAQLHLLAKSQPLPGQDPVNVQFSPDGQLVAVGFDGDIRVMVLNGTDLITAYWPDTRGVDNGDLGRVAWSADGQFLFAGGMWQANGGCPIRRWTLGGRGAFNDVLIGANNTLMQIVPLRDGGLLWGAQDPAWGILNPDRTQRTVQRPVVADYRALLDKFKLSNDGAMVDFGFQYGGGVPGRFNVGARALQTVALSTLGTSDPKTSAPGFNITDWEDNTQPQLNGKPLALMQYETSRSLAIAPDNASFLLGASWYLRRFNRAGGQEWEKPILGTAWAVNISRDGRLAVAAFGDGTIRWYRYWDGKELLVFFPHADQKRWVVWTPTGYYDCSPDGEDLIGWHVNNGRDKAADFFPASRYRSTFYRPDVIARVLKTLDEGEALRQADKAAGRTNATVPVADVVKDQSPPVVRLVSPDGATLSTDAAQISLRYALRSPSGEPVTGVRVMIDGRPTNTDANLQLRPAAIGGEIERTVTVDVPPRDCEVSVLAINRFFVFRTGGCANRAHHHGARHAATGRYASSPAREQQQKAVDFGGGC